LNYQTKLPFNSIFKSDRLLGFNPRYDQKRTAALTRCFVLVLVVVLVLESGHAE
jgi:hypothetical protein